VVIGCAVWAACGGSDSTAASNRGSSDGMLDPAEIAASADAMRDDLMVESVVLDDAVEPEAMMNAQCTQALRGVTSVGPAQALRWRYPKPIYKLLRAWGALVPNECVTETQWVDADSDGVPLNAVYTFLCSLQPGSIPPGRSESDGRTVEVSGRVTIADVDDAISNNGYRVQFDAFTVRVSRPSGLTRTRTLSGEWIVSAKAGSAAAYVPFSNGLDMATSLTVSQVYATPTGSLTWTHRLVGNTSYVPDGDTMLEPFARGTAVISGAATHSMQLGDRVWLRTWSRQTEPSLHWNRSCRDVDPLGYGFDDGRVRYFDDRGNSLIVDFDGCGVPMVTINGARI